MANSLHDLLRATYGIDTIDEEKTELVGTTVSAVLNNDPQRMGVIMYNLSANTIHVSTRADVSSTKGFALIGNGSGLAFNWEHDGILITRRWHAIATGANSALYIAYVRINPISQIPSIK